MTRPDLSSSCLSTSSHSCALQPHYTHFSSWRWLGGSTLEVLLSHGLHLGVTSYNWTAALQQPPNSVRQEGHQVTPQHPVNWCGLPWHRLMGKQRQRVRCPYLPWGLEEDRTPVSRQELSSSAQYGSGLSTALKGCLFLRVPPATKSGVT